MTLHSTFAKLDLPPVPDLWRSDRSSGEAAELRERRAEDAAAPPARTAPDFPRPLIGRRMAAA